MTKFLHEYQVIVLAVIKILIMLGYFLQIAPILVFAERRQAALIQDRVGPNRARITLPGIALKGGLATPAILAALAVLGLCFGVFPPSETADGVSRGFWMAQIGVLLIWSNTLILAGWSRVADSTFNPIESFFRVMDDPRWIFYTGVIAHVTLLVAYGGLSPSHAETAAKAFAFAGPALLAVGFLLIGGYMGYRIPSGPVDLRVAGMLHSMADTLKLLFKEDFIPPKGDKLLHALAPVVALLPALITYAVIPFGDTVCFEATKEGYTNFTSLVAEAPRVGVCTQNAVSLQIADLNVGILFMFAIAGTGIIGAALAGWSSDNKFSLLGGLRAASQMVSYEVAMGLSLVGAFMVYGSPRLNDMVRWQNENAWGIFVQPVAFFLFFAAAIAEHKRVPFDAPEGESELAAGYFLEYSSMKFVMFMTGEYVEMAISSAVLVTLFLGGWSLPFLHRDGLTIAIGETVLLKVALSHFAVTILQVLTFFGKVTAFTFWSIFIRWTVPRFRYDQIMAFGWRFLLPASIGNLVVTGLLVLGAGSAGESVQATLKVVADLTNVVVVAAFAYIAYLIIKLMLSPVDRKKFTTSSTAAYVARLGGVKSEPMQA
jgi:NADH-quinone oxidoreductase subunit H